MPPQKKTLARLELPPRRAAAIHAAQRLADLLARLPEKPISEEAGALADRIAIAGDDACNAADRLAMTLDRLAEQ